MRDEKFYFGQLLRCKDTGITGIISEVDFEKRIVKIMVRGIEVPLLIDKVDEVK